MTDQWEVRHPASTHMVTAIVLTDGSATISGQTARLASGPCDLPCKQPFRCAYPGTSGVETPSDLETPWT